jgi:hypothetical protein
MLQLSGNQLMRRILSLSILAMLLALAFSVRAQTGCDKSNACPAGGGSGSVYVQSCTGSSGSTVSSFTVTCPSAATAGHFFFLEMKVNNTGTVFSVTGESISGALSGYPVNVYGTNEIYLMTDTITTGRTTYTVNCGTTNCSFPDATWDEYAPNGHTMTLDKNSVMPVTGPSGITVTSSSITPTLSNELIACPTSVNNTSSGIAFTAPFSAGTNSGGGQVIGHYIQSTAAAISCTASWTGSQDSSIGILSFE